MGNNVVGGWDKDHCNAFYFDDIEGAIEATRYFADPWTPGYLVRRKLPDAVDRATIRRLQARHGKRWMAAAAERL